jgi:hypothetical protein
VVVEVVLAGDLRALALQDAGERVADGGPAGAAEVDGPGRVGGDELEVDDLVGAGVVGAVGRARLDDRLREGAGGGGIQPDVDEAGPGDLDRRDAVGRGERVGDLLRELARVRPTTLPSLSGVGRPVAVVAVARALEGKSAAVRPALEPRVAPRRAGR